MKNAVDRMVKDMDREMKEISRSVTAELQENTTLSDGERRLGRLVVSLLDTLLKMKEGARIDDDMARQIEEVLDIRVSDDSIIDLGRVSYSDTFKAVLVEILNRSVRQTDSPVLRHVYRNLLDIEQLMVRHAVGFVTGDMSRMRTYMYIVWMMWAYTVHCEQELQRRCEAAGTDPLSGSVYGGMRGEDCAVLTVGYSTLARRAVPHAYYMHGCTDSYVDVENKNSVPVDVAALDLGDFFGRELPGSMCLEGKGRKSVLVPSFLPPTKVRLLLSYDYLSTWYRADAAMRAASEVVVLGYPLSADDCLVSGMLRQPKADITVVCDNLETTGHDLCRILQQSEDRYTPLRSLPSLPGCEARVYNQHITVIQADAVEWMRVRQRQLAARAANGTA